MLPRRFYFDSSLDHLFNIDDKMKCDIYEENNIYHVILDLPGFLKEDIKIECNKGNLVISAEKNDNGEDVDNNKKYIRRERIYGRYFRSFYLGDIDEDNISASFNNGTLSISIPKVDQDKSKKNIDIN